MTRKIISIILFLVSIDTFAQQVELTIQSGHFGNINALQFSNNGRWLASGGDDAQVKIWDIASGRLVKTYQAGGDVTSLCFSPSSESLAAIVGSGELVTWRISSNEIPSRIKIPSDSTTTTKTKIFFDNSEDGLVVLANERLYRKRGNRLEYLNIKGVLDADYHQGKRALRYISLDGRIHFEGDNTPAANFSVLNRVDKRLIQRGEFTARVSMRPEVASVAVAKGWKLEVHHASGEPDFNHMQGDYMDDSFRDAVFIGKQNMVVAVNTDGQVYRIDLTRKKNKTKLSSDHVDDLYALAINRDETYFATAGADRSIILWDTKTWKPVRTLFGKNYRIETVTIDEQSGRVTIGDELGYVKSIDIRDRSVVMESHKLHKYALSHIVNYKDKFITTGFDNRIKIIDRDYRVLEDKKLMKKFTPAFFVFNKLGLYRPYRIPVMNLSVYEKSSASLDRKMNYTMTLPDLSRIKRKKPLPERPFVVAEQGYSYALLGNVSSQMNYYKVNVPAYVFGNANGHTHTITDFVHSDILNVDITSSWDCSIKIWNPQSEQLLATIIPFGTKNSRAIITPDNYYMIDKKAFEGLNFKVKDKVFSAEQFDLKFNRPDIVLARLGGFPPELIAAYEKAYQKRLKKLGFTEQSLDSTFHAPELTVTMPGNQFIVTTPNFPFKVAASDSLFQLDRMNIWINGVPMYGIKGKDLRRRNSQRYEGDESVYLSPGRNLIEVSVLNDRGVESYKEKLQIEYRPTSNVKPDLHLVVIGVSQYQNKNYNLTYAAKDAKDLRSLFSSGQDYFGKVIVHEVTNEQATAQKVRALKEELMKTKVNDHVYVFFSGHGVLNKELDYFLATHDLNFSNPGQNGLLYDDLEGVIDGIPARQKLLMVDACHSGELDKEEIQILENTTASSFEEVKMTKSGDQSVGSKTIGLENSFELMKQQFVDLRKSTGATVISAAGGVEFAYEGLDGLKNGVFTHAVITGLKNKKADLDGDGIILLSELQQYVAREVTRLTNGKQQPTSRIENLINDFRIK